MLQGIHRCFVGLVRSDTLFIHILSHKHAMHGSGCCFYSLQQNSDHCHLVFMHTFLICNVTGVLLHCAVLGVSFFGFYTGTGTIKYIEIITERNKTHWQQKVTVQPNSERFNINSYLVCQLSTCMYTNTHTWFFLLHTHKHPHSHTDTYMSSAGPEVLCSDDLGHNKILVQLKQLRVLLQQPATTPQAMPHPEPAQPLQIRPHSSLSYPQTNPDT